MKMLYIGPSMGAKKMKEVHQKHFRNLEIDCLQYENYMETPALLEQYTGKVDAILFGGKAPLKAFEPVRKKYNVLYDSIPRHDTTLYRALLEAIYLCKRDIKRLSLDTFKKKDAENLLREVGIEVENSSLYFAEQRMEQKDYADYLVDFHSQLYREGKVDCCITGVAEVYRRLMEEGIPITYSIASEMVFVQSIENLHLRWLAKKNSENQIVVIAVKLNIPSEYSLIKEDEYAYLSQRIKIMDKLYYFSSRIDGILVEQGKNDFLIFTTKKTIELETNNYKNIYLLDLLREVSVVIAHIGIGYGSTVSESKFNAYESIKMALRHGEGAVYVVFENGEVRGPIESVIKEKKEANLDEKFYQISKDTGLSVNTIYRIFRNVSEEMQKTFTSRELAELCGVSVRTMDRIVNKLCDAGYCDVIGERLMSKHGRPSRILQFKSYLASGDV